MVDRAITLKEATLEDVRHIYISLGTGDKAGQLQVIEMGVAPKLEEAGLYEKLNLAPFNMVKSAEQLPPEALAKIQDILAVLVPLAVADLFTEKPPPKPEETGDVAVEVTAADVEDGKEVLG